MRYLLLPLLCCFFSLIGHPQIIKTKDGVSLGTRSDFMEGCISGIKEDTLNFNGIRINKIQYCSCVCDNLIPTLYDKEIEDAIKSDTLVQLFLEDKNLSIIMKCLKGNVSLDSNYEFKYHNSDSALTRKVAILSCVNKIMDDTLNNKVWTRPLAESYCSCAIDRLYSKGYQLNDINSLLDKNSEAYNEIIVPCINQTLGNHLHTHTSESYMPGNITGDNDSTEVPLTDYLGQAYKIKISIDGITYYYLLDTGASDLIINDKIEKKLQQAGYLKKEDYVGTKAFTLADNTQIHARLVKLHNIRIGNFEVKNAIAAIFVNGQLLCGKGFLDNFRKWDIRKDDRVLVLYK